MSDKTTRKVMCNSCKEKFYKEELIQKSKSVKLCKNCDEQKRKDAQDYQNLIKYIVNGFGLKAPTGHQLKSIKEFKQMGYTYQEMQYTLYYIFGVLGKKIEGNSIGLIPYYYEKAMEHLRLIENAKRTARKLCCEEIVVKMNDNRKPNLNKTRLINIEEL